MNLFQLKDFTKGWLIGDFEPNIFRTKEFEFMVRSYKKGDKEARHVHKIAQEVTVIVSGVFLMNDKKLEAGDVVLLAPGEVADFECLEDGANAVIKAPSVLDDKYLI